MRDFFLLLSLIFLFRYQKGDMFFAVLSIGLLAFVTHAQEDSTCQNPVFLQPSEWNVDSRFNFGNRVDLPNRPVPFPSQDITNTTVCSFYASLPGNLSCCDANALRLIANAVRAVNVTMQSYVNDINNNKWVDQLLKLLAKMPGNSDAEKDLQTLSELFSNLTAAQATCARTLSAYTEGMLCFACNPQYNSFLDNATKTWRLATSTCDRLVAGCKGVYLLVNDIVSNSKGIVNKLFPGMKNFVKDLPDMCNGTADQPGDCERAVCDRWVHGLHIPTYKWKAQDDPSGQDLEDRHVVELLYKSFGALSSSSLSTSPEVPGGNVYVTSGGYDPMTVGCNTGVDTECPEPVEPDDTGSDEDDSGRLMVAVAVAGAVVAVGAAISFVYLELTYRRGHADVEQSQPLTKA